MRSQTIQLLLAEDDPDDQLLARRALEASGMAHTLTVVANGEELLNYLSRRGAYAAAQRPDLILLDLNMPRMDGREALRMIKARPELRAIPVVVLTTSSDRQDVQRSYELGVNSYIEKPTSFKKLLEVVDTLRHYWFSVVRLPSPER